MEEKKEILVDFIPKKKYIKAEGFKKYYITGAIGGFRNPYDFRLTFYNIDSNEFLIETQVIKGEKEIKENELLNKLSQKEMLFNLQCEVIMTERAARELCTFIGKELETIDKNKKKGIT